MARKRPVVRRRRGSGKAPVPAEDTRTTIKCAYCDGTGKDPWGIPSILSKCQVCSGKGIVKIREPAVKCAACNGTGVHLGKRLSCLACGGKGLISIKGPMEECPVCEGLGVDSNGLYCTHCKGKGVVGVKEKVEVDEVEEEKAEAEEEEARLAAENFDRLMGGLPQIAEAEEEKTETDS